MPHFTFPRVGLSPEKRNERVVSHANRGDVGSYTQLRSARLAEILSKPNLVGADMEGASFDISVVQNGRVTLESERYLMSTRPKP
jgi:hypothetical protein